MEMPSFEPEKTNELPKYEKAIRDFLRDYFNTVLKERKQSPYDPYTDVHFSDTGDGRGFGPLQSGDYEITNFETAPLSGGRGTGFHFKAGGVETYLTGKAAQKIAEMIEN